MLMNRTSRLALVALAASAAVLLLVAAASARPNGTAATPAAVKRAAATQIVIWADKDRKPAVTSVATAWAQSKGLTVNVVEKDFGSIRNDLGTVKAENAPDVIVGAHDWTG